MLAGFLSYDPYSGTYNVLGQPMQSVKVDAKSVSLQPASPKTNVISIDLEYKDH